MIYVLCALTVDLLNYLYHLPLKGFSFFLVGRHTSLYNELYFTSKAQAHLS